MRFAVVSAALGVSIFALLACERPPSADKAREWTPADHDQEEQAQSGAQAPPPKGDAGGAPSLTQTIWASSCATCHGPMGHGDGPTGPMVNAPDLTRESWQSTVTDADIGAMITTGKGKMPKFDLPPAVVTGLVARIRALRGR